MEVMVVIVIVGVLASLALMKFRETVEIQRYRNHKNNLIQLRGKLQEYYYKNKTYPVVPGGNLDGLNTSLGTYIEDTGFVYTFVSTQSPPAFQIDTVRGSPTIYSCRMRSDFSYPQCTGNPNLPE